MGEPQVPAMTRYRRDFSNLTVDTVDALADSEFFELVNADLKRNATNSPGQVPIEVSRSLRGGRHAKRRLEILKQILISVDGQLLSRQSDYFSNRGQLRKRIILAEESGDRSTMHSLRLQLEDLGIQFNQAQAKTRRFRQIVNDAATDTMSRTGLKPDSGIVAHERDKMSARVTTLEDAIRTHRDLVLADLQPGELPDEIDVDLWDVLPE
jgi:hypothetical protein